MQRLRIIFASLLLLVAGVSVFGRRAFAAPRIPSDSLMPQACSDNTSTGGATGGSIGTGYINFGSGTGTGSGGTGGTGGTGGGTGSDDVAHHAKK